MIYLNGFSSNGRLRSLSEVIGHHTPSWHDYLFVKIDLCFGGKRERYNGESISFKGSWVIFIMIPASGKD